MLSIDGYKIHIGDTFVNGVKINYNELNLPPYTMRVLYKEGTAPSLLKGTATQVSQTPNIWDVKYESEYWDYIFQQDTNLVEVLGANTTDVTYMAWLFNGCSALSSVSIFDTSKVDDTIGMFNDCKSLTSVPYYDTSNVHYIGAMFRHCKSLSSVPLYDTSHVSSLSQIFDECENLTEVPKFNTKYVTEIDRAFRDCYNVTGGALSMYQQVSGQVTIPSAYKFAFQNCGASTQTGSAELAQIPSDWK